MTWQIATALAILLFGPILCGVLVGIIVDAALSLRDLRREAEAGETCPPAAPRSGRYCPPVSSRT